MPRSLVSLVFVALAAGLALSAGTAFADRGGPDSAGYRFIDSDEPNGPDFNWIDISESGTAILDDTDDEVEENIPLGFSFRFYSQSFSRVNISSNGNIQFSSDSTSTGGSLPYEDMGPAIFAWFDDLLSDDDVGCGEVYYDTISRGGSRQFVVEWQICHFDHDEEENATLACAADFELVLFEGSNEILAQYRDVTFSGSGCPAKNDDEDFGESASVGIQRDGDNLGLIYSEDEPNLKANLAICYRPRDAAGDPCEPSDIADEIPGSQGGRFIGGGIFGNLDAAERNRERANAAGVAAAAPAPASAPAAAVRPPSTGDAGLAARDNAGLTASLAVITAAGFLLLSIGWKLHRR